MSRARMMSTRSRYSSRRCSEGVDVLVNNASSLGPVPLAPLADTSCEHLEAALATNLLGPFRLTKAVLGSLTAAARDGRGGLVVNVSSDAAVSAYEGWGAYGLSKAALLHLTRIWHAELAPLGVEMVSFNPGDMDTPLHAAALPDADRSLLKQPAAAARELCDTIAAHLTRRSAGRSSCSHDRRRAPDPSSGRCPCPARGCRRPAVASRPPRLADAPPAGRRRHRQRCGDDPGKPPRHAPAAPAAPSKCGWPDATRSCRRRSIACRAIVFGEGDYRTPTERPVAAARPASRRQAGAWPGDRACRRILGHSRFVTVEFEASPSQVWEAIARHGRPVQYAHVPEPLAVWDTWTALAAQPVAFEPPSAGFALTWAAVAALTARGIRFATLTHAAGLSSTGDPSLDARLPLDEPYDIPRSTARLVNRARAPRPPHRRGRDVGRTGARARRARDRPGPRRAWPGDRTPGSGLPAAGGGRAALGHPRARVRAITSCCGPSSRTRPSPASTRSSSQGTTGPTSSATRSSLRLPGTRDPGSGIRPAPGARRSELGTGTGGLIRP